MPPGYTSIGSMKNFIRSRGALAGARLTSEALIETGTALIGSPRTVLNGLELMRERTGSAILVALLQFGILSDDLTRRNMDLFAAEVESGLPVRREMPDPGTGLDLVQPPPAIREAFETIHSDEHAVMYQRRFEDRGNGGIGNQRFRTFDGLGIIAVFRVDQNSPRPQEPSLDADLDTRRADATPAGTPRALSRGPKLAENPGVAGRPTSRMPSVSLILSRL